MLVAQEFATVLQARALLWSHTSPRIRDEVALSDCAFEDGCAIGMLCAKEGSSYNPW